MRVRMFLTIMSVLSLLFSASAMAHVTDSSAVLPHILTGEHLLILAVVSVCIGVLSRLYRHFR